MKSLVSCNQCEFDCESEEELKHHSVANHSNIDCANWNFKTDEETVLKDHAADCTLQRKVHHEVQKSNQETVNNETIHHSETDVAVDKAAVICGVCSSAFITTLECEEHMRTHTQTFKCNVCDINVTTELEHDCHKEKNHEEGEQAKVQYIECKMCDYKSPTEPYICKSECGPI